MTAKQPPAGKADDGCAVQSIEARIGPDPHGRPERAGHRKEGRQGIVTPVDLSAFLFGSGEALGSLVLIGKPRAFLCKNPGKELIQTEVLCIGSISDALVPGNDLSLWLTRSYCAITCLWFANFSI
jgi:hypothetical protein